MTIIRSQSGKYLVVNDSEFRWTDNRHEATVFADDRTAMNWESKFYGAYRISADPVL
jgi:hypothetical protein